MHSIKGIKKERKRERKKRLERCEALTNDKSNDDDSRGEGGGDGDGDGNLENHGRWAMGRVVYVCWRRVERVGGWVVGWFGGGCIGVVASVRRQEGKPPAESNLTNQYLGFKGIARPIIPD